MELRTTQRLRRNEQMAKITAAKQPSAAKPQAGPAKAPADKVSVSRQALEWLDRRAQLDLEQEERRRARQSDSLNSLDSQKQALERLERGLDVLEKCQKIAASIIKGNRVPPEDLVYLMNNDPAGYKLAMAMRRENPDPEDEKSVLDEEDKNGGTVERIDGGGETPSSVQPSGGEAVAAE